MARYIALIDRSDDLYGAWIPDAPGCTAMGESADEAIRNITEALAEWATDEVNDGRTVPEPHPLESLTQTEEVRAAIENGAVVALVPLVRNSGRPARANISLDEGLLQAIDEAAGRMGLTRSAFLATAAREKIESGA